MNYYYDILINLEEEYYEFYEWEKKDEIIPIKKIPIYKVDHQTILDFLQYEITISNSLLTELIDKTIVKNSKEKLTCLLLTDSKTTLCVELNKNGKVIYKSKLLVEDENNINEISSSFSLTQVDYQTGKLLTKRNNLRRIEKEINIIKLELNNLRLNKNDEKCSYLYYELFHDFNNNYLDKIEKMNEELNKASYKVIHRLYHLINLTNKEKLI